MKKHEIIKQWASTPQTFDSLKSAYTGFVSAGNKNINYETFKSSLRKLTSKGDNKIVLSTVTLSPSTIAAPTTVAPKIWQAKDIVFDDAILIPIQTNTIVDKVISIAGGVMPATLTIVPGESGCGKTTMVLYICSLIKKENPGKRILFVSSEMNSIHIFKYAKRIDMTGIDVFLMSESDYPKQEFEAVLAQGWDIVILDSLQDTINKIRLQTGDTSNAVENNTLKLLDNIRRGNNDHKLYTAFLCTHHMTKGGTYTGSTNLKHMTDAMMELKTDPKSPDQPYIEYSKNRDGQKEKRLYFKIRQNDIQFNEERFESDLRIDDKVTKHKELLDQKSFNFDQIFLQGKEVETTEESTDLQLAGANWHNNRSQVVASNEILNHLNEE